jgi:hypothetical protein
VRGTGQGGKTERSLDRWTFRQLDIKISMPKSTKILLLLLIVILFSCEEQGIFVKCPDCTKEEPVNVSLDVKLDINYYGTTKIKVYEGNLEDSILYETYFTSHSTFSVPVTINKKYTLTATYYIPDNYYIVVDSATPRDRYEKDQCDNPCYFVYDKIVDLRLK